MGTSVRCGVAVFINFKVFRKGRSVGHTLMSAESSANSTEEVCHAQIQADDGVASYSYQYIFILMLILLIKSKSGRSRSKPGTDVTGLTSSFRRLTTVGDILCTPTVVVGDILCTPTVV